MAGDDTWFRHKGRWPLTTRWPATVDGDARLMPPTAQDVSQGVVGKPVGIAPPRYEPTPQLLTTAEAAKIVRLSPRTLERLRVSGDGPRYIKAGPGKRALVLYRETDLTSWLECFAFGSTSEYALREKSRLGE